MQPGNNQTDTETLVESTKIQGWDIRQPPYPGPRELLFLSLILSWINAFGIIIIISVGRETLNLFATIWEVWCAPPPAALACVVELNKNVSGISLIPQGTWCLRNAISSRKDARRIAWLCGVFAEIEKGHSYQFLQTISAQWPRFDSLVEKRLVCCGQVTGTLHCLELHFVLSADLPSEQGALSLPWLAVA